jgi:hypothetical protein
LNFFFPFCSVSSDPFPRFFFFLLTQAERREDLLKQWRGEMEYKDREETDGEEDVDEELRMPVVFLLSTRAVRPFSFLSFLRFLTFSESCSGRGRPQPSATSVSLLFLFWFSLFSLASQLFLPPFF